MLNKWLCVVLGLSVFLLCTLKSHELQGLRTFYKGERVIKLQKFQDARKKVAKEELDLLKLWESMLTGRSAPLSKLMKEKYQTLGLNHLFTPSGFHLSAAVFPFIKVLNKKYHLLILLLLGIGFFFLPGLGALKRMLVIKTHQEVLGLHLGFSLALVVDMLFGTFQNGALSFTYSFLFLGIIYSGFSGLRLIIWFFLAQILLAYFQNSDISLLLLIFSPLLNFGFGILMPVLFILSIPLWDWQLQLGITLLGYLQGLVDMISSILFRLPMIEVHIGIILLFAFIVLRRKKESLILFILMTSSLNLDRGRIPGAPTYEFVPQGDITLTKYSEKNVLVKFEDGQCRMNLVRGFWYENCSPKRRSSHNRKFKKLSYPS